VLDHASVCEQIGEPQQALQNLWAITAREPLHEPAHVRLMIALASSGEQAAALHVYEDIRLRLDRELGVYPSPELADAHMQVLNRAASPAPVAVLGAQHSRNRATGYHGRAVGQAVRPQQLPTAVPHFVGRTQELTALTKMLDHAGGCRSAVISAIGGTAGIGKTALAVHWAHETADRFRDGQLYVNLRGFDPAAEPMSASEVVRGFLDALGVQPEQIPADLTAQVGLYRSLLADMQMLVLLDNARDEEQVRPLLPGGTACMAVVTSRRRLPGLVAEGAQPIMLDVLADQEARDLLAHRIGLERVAAETDAVDAVIELCARLPLGLSITAAHAAVRPGITVKALAAQLRDVRHRLDALETGDVATGMRAVFSCSYRGLDAEEARMFRLMGVHPGPDISAHAAASLAAVPPWRARQMLLTLTVANLLSEISPGRFAFHDLLRVYSREQARATDSDAHRRAAVGRMLDHYLLAADTADLMLRPDREPLLLPAIAPGVTPERLADERQSRNWFGVEHRVLIAAITMAADMGFDTHTWQLAWALGSFLDWRGHWPEWTTTQTVALAAARRLGDLTGQARTHWELGRAFVRLCSYVDARSHMYDALAIYEKLGDVVGQANSHYGLSEAFGREGVMIASDGQGSAAGPYAASLDHGQQALSLYRSASHHTGQAKALNGIGWCHALREEYRPALGYCQQALQLLRGSDERVLAGAVLDSLGYIHSHRGDYRQAVARYEEAAKLFHERGHHHEAEVLTHLGDAHHAAGNDQSARDAWRQALTILRRLHQPDAEKVRAKLRGIHAAASKDIGT
jgi:tetratricopeptide (TPR) repeat protein